MCSSPNVRTVTVVNRDGLHARAASAIAALVRRYRAEVKVVKGTERVDAIDVLQVLTLGTHEGEVLALEATGEEAVAVLDDLAELFAKGFPDPPQGKESE